MSQPRRSLRSKIKRGALRFATGCTRVDRSGGLERLLQDRLIDRVGSSVAQLTTLAWVSEEEGEWLRAIEVWKRVAKITESEYSQHEIHQKAVRKIVQLETQLRRSVDAAATADTASVLLGDQDIGAPVAPKNTPIPGGYALKAARLLLTRFWESDIGDFNEDTQDALCAGYCRLVVKHTKAGDYYDALKAVQPVLAYWPEYRDVYPLYYKLVLKLLTEPETDQTAENGINAKDLSETWWRVFGERRRHLDADTLDGIWAQSEQAANRLIADDRILMAEQVIAPAFRYWPDKNNVLPILARAAEMRQDWRSSGAYWQLYAAITNPVTTKSRSHVAENPEEMRRKSNYARNRLRQSRIHRARELHQSGNHREFGELVSRIVEAVPDQRVFKNDPGIVDIVRTYVQDALHADGVSAQIKWPLDNKPIKIALCLDVLKISDVHTHTRVLFTICRNLMALDDRIETHIIVTNERFGVTTPVVSASFNPSNDTIMQDTAQKALPEFFNSRFFLHNFKSNGLEGIIDTCKSIIEICPDILLYGGGHKGMFSNESRVVRHCLFDHFPTTFFYIQSNNEVDEKLDMIIARGPHEITGNTGDALVKVQPYPTILDTDVIADVPIDAAKMDSKTIVSAITGVRMDTGMNAMEPETLNTILSVLDQVPGSVWHLVGAQDPQAVIDSNPLIADRVKAEQMMVHPVMSLEAFTSFVSETALFFHMPGFTGGSGGATVARRAGIPIITFRHSDVSGRQPAASIFDATDVTGAVAKAVELLQNRRAWGDMVKAQFAHTAWIRATSAQGFYDCLCDCIDHSRKRLGAPEKNLSKTADQTGSIVPAAKAAG